MLNRLDDQVDVLEAATVSEAVQFITHARVLDLILLDIDLPDVDGLTALPVLKSLAPTVPLAVLSGSENAEHVQSALDHG